MDLDSCHFSINSAGFNVLREPPWYGTVCPVVWEDGGREPPSYPMPRARPRWNGRGEGS